jgi:hypothetical protein
LQIDQESAEQAELDLGATRLSERLKIAREAFEHQAMGNVTIFNTEAGLRVTSSQKP